MTLQPADLDRLEQLAREARDKQVHAANWAYWVRLVLMAGPARDFIEAASPATVSELVAAARLGVKDQGAAYELGYERGRHEAVVALRRRP